MPQSARRPLPRLLSTLDYNRSKSLIALSISPLRETNSCNVNPFTENLPRRPRFPPAPALRPRFGFPSRVGQSGLCSKPLPRLPPPHCGQVALTFAFAMLVLLHPKDHAKPKGILAASKQKKRAGIPKDTRPWAPPLSALPMFQRFLLITFASGGRIPVKIDVVARIDRGAFLLESTRYYHLDTRMIATGRDLSRPLP